MGSHGNISKFSIDKSLNNTTDEPPAKMKNFFMTPGVEARKID